MLYLRWPVSGYSTARSYTKRTLVIEVFDEDLIKNDLLGRVEIDVALLLEQYRDTPFVTQRSFPLVLAKPYASEAGNVFPRCLSVSLFAHVC
mgnify:CR=1 FL=1